jgi:hypothetical protein
MAILVERLMATSSLRLAVLAFAMLSDLVAT